MAVHITTARRFDPLAFPLRLTADEASGICFYNLAQLLTDNIADVLGKKMAAHVKMQRKAAILAEKCARMLSNENFNWMTIANDIKDIQDEFSMLSVEEQLALSPLKDGLDSLNEIIGKLNWFVTWFSSSSFHIADVNEWKSLFSEGTYHVEHYGVFDRIVRHPLTATQIVESIVKTYSTATYNGELIAGLYFYKSSGQVGDSLLAIMDQFKNKITAIANDLMAFADLEKARVHVEETRFQEIINQK